MKKAMIALALILAVSVQAQEKKDDKREARKEMRDKFKDLTPQQMADLRTKEMTLALDLNDSQQKKLNTLELNRATKMKEKMATRGEKKELTKDEAYNRRSEMLDARIEYKKEMKSILTEEQFQKWEKSQKHRRGGRKGKNDMRKGKK